MNEKIDKIVIEGKALVEKKTWITKGYTELMEKLNRELAKIPDMDEKPISFTLREWMEEDHSYYGQLERKVTLKMIFKGDAYLEMRMGRDRGPVWEWEENEAPSFATIRAFAGKLGETFDYFVKTLQDRNIEDKLTIDIIQDLSDKLG